MANSNCLEGIACPACGQEECFRIAIKTTVLVYDDGTEEDNLAGDTEWDDTSYCECRDCGHHGVVKDFKMIDNPAERAEYDEYFDAMERANKQPLSYPKWKKSRK